MSGSRSSLSPTSYVRALVISAPGDPHIALDVAMLNCQSIALKAISSVPILRSVLQLLGFSGAGNPLVSSTYISTKSHNSSRRFFCGNPAQFQLSILAVISTQFPAAQIIKSSGMHMHPLRIEWTLYTAAHGNAPARQQVHLVKVGPIHSNTQLSYVAPPTIFRDVAADVMFLAGHGKHHRHPNLS